MKDPVFTDKMTVRGVTIEGITGGITGELTDSTTNHTSSQSPVVKMQSLRLLPRAFAFVQMQQLSADHDILAHQRLKMKRKTPLGTSYYEIVKYNLRTRKDLQVVPGRVQGLSEVNQKIDTLNARLKSSREDEGGDIVYYRRKVQS